MSHTLSRPKGLQTCLRAQGELATFHDQRQTSIDTLLALFLYMAADVVVCFAQFLKYLCTSTFKAFLLITATYRLLSCLWCHCSLSVNLLLSLHQQQRQPT